MIDGEQAMDHRSNVYRGKLNRAEEFVRDVLRIMGQSADADNPTLVREVALRVLVPLAEQEASHD
jgi:hypothetical protein